MLHPKQHIIDLAHICFRKNVRKVVISPGSRSAPLIDAFYQVFGDNCISLVDERSAAYYALGVALYTGEPVAIICTSGTAVLNYAPAIAEAYYQKIPLIAITADRPNEWIDQQDNQTLRQRDIYRNFIRGSFELPQYIATRDDLWFAHRMISEALYVCTHIPGPVHINVPLTEPLYDELPPCSEKLHFITPVIPETPAKLPDDLIREWNQAKRIMIIHGQDSPDETLSQVLHRISTDPRVVLLAENISNIHSGNSLTGSNLVLSVTRSDTPAYPDLILHSGGQVVSRALAGYLRKSGQTSLWRIGTDDGLIDTYRLATRFIRYEPRFVYSALEKMISKEGNYRDQWLSLNKQATQYTSERLSQLPFSDSHVFRLIMKSIPDQSMVLLGNSSVIRYSQLFEANSQAVYYANRGVSGIDGSLSTASGIAYASEKTTIAISGDLGFLYDSNALWNRDLSPYLKIVVINNRGGGIFHIIKGPSDRAGFKKFVEADHPVNIAKLADAYGLAYMQAENEDTLYEKWPDFIDRKQPIVFEIKTSAETSAMVFRKLMTAAE